MIGKCEDLGRYEATSRETKEDRNTDKARFFMLDYQAASFLKVAKKFYSIHGGKIPPLKHLASEEQKVKLLTCRSSPLFSLGVAQSHWPHD